MHYRGLQIVHVDFVFGDAEAKFIGRAVYRARFQAGTCLVGI